MVYSNIRARILQAAIDLVGEYGYKGTTTRMIAERAGVNEVTLFRKFGSKFELFESAVKYLQSQISGMIQHRKIELTGNLEIDLKSLSLSLIEFLTANKEAVLTVLFEARREQFLHDAGESMISFIIGFMNEFLSNNPQTANMDKKERNILAISVLSFIFLRTVVRERVLEAEYSEDDREEELEQFIKLIDRGVKGIGDKK